MPQPYAIARRGLVSVSNEEVHNHFGTINIIDVQHMIRCPPGGSTPPSRETGMRCRSLYGDSVECHSRECGKRVLWTQMARPEEPDSSAEGSIINGLHVGGERRLCFAGRSRVMGTTY